MRMEIFIGNQKAYTDSDTRPLITKQIIDIQKPENRKSDRTLTFSLPGTPENDDIFGGMFDVNLAIQNTSTDNFTPDFNPNLRAAFVLVVDTVTQLSGYCQLTEINITRDNTVRYNIVAYGATSDLFSVIGESLLTDLDFSEYDHQWTADNVSNSWATSIIQNGSSIPFQLGRGYVYPMIDYGQTTAPFRWKTTNFYPALFFKEYLDKIFAAAGYTYESDFLTSTLFKSLIAPFTAGEFKIDNDDAVDRLIDVERITTDQTMDVCNSGGGPRGTSYDLSTGSEAAFQQENSDPSAQWSTDTFTTTVQGQYIFQGYAPLSFKNNTGGALIGLSGLRLVLGLVKYDGANYSVLSFVVSDEVDPGTPWASGGVTSVSDFYYSFSPVTLAIGDQVFVKPLFIADSPGVASSGITFFGQDNVQCIFAVGSYLITQLGQNQLVEGDTIPMNSTVPVDVKQKDFLLGIIRSFNLYVQPDANISNRLLIEPREDYYTADIEDWTYKLDESQDFKIEPMGLLDAERYIFQYSDDGDYLNKAHKDRYGYSYGRRKIDVTNQFVKQDKVIQPVFAPTPLSAPQGYADRIVSQIIFVDQNGQTSVKAAKMRMLYYGGLKTCVPWLFGTLPLVTKTSYPYAGHLDDPKNPTLDLNFGAPAEIYYGAAFASVGQLSYTDNNLYKAYSQVMIEEITNKDSKVVSGYFYLTPYDIGKLSFRKQYFIKEAYYRLLSVNNYDPISQTACLCKFLKAKYIPPIPPVTADMAGGKGQISPGDTEGGNDLPVWDLMNPANGNEKMLPGNGIIIGEDNTTGGGVQTGFVIGNTNYLPGNTQNIAVLAGDGNQILADQVVIINSHDQVVTEPNTTIINGVRHENRLTVEVSSAEMKAISSPIALLPAPGQDRTIEVVNVRARRINSTVGYSAENIVVRYTNSDECAQFATELLTATGENVYKATIFNDLIINTGIEITTLSGSDPITGDGNFIFYIDYIIQDI